MASQQSIVEYISEQMGGAGSIVAKKMFGEYGIYCDDKFIGVICNDTLFLKPTPEGISFSGDLEQLPPYKGAKPSLVVPQNGVDNADWLAKLVAITANALPATKKKIPKAKG